MTLFRPLLLLVFVLLSVGSALAHAVVVSSSPSARETMRGEPLSIEVRFNSRIDQARSALRLFDRDGKPLPLEAAESAPETLAAKAGKLPPGQYRVHWQTLSPDGHISQGDIPFQVAP